MKLAVSPKDLQSLRRLIANQVNTLVHLPNPAGVQRDIEVGRKMVRKLNAALKRMHGHDCMGSYYLEQMQ